MDLWIRTQDDLSLMKVNNILLYRGCEIATRVVGRGLILLGKYEAARALEVLDDIQNFMEIDYKEEFNTYEEADLLIKTKMVESMQKIYIMPKE